jgi:DNA polymerase-1
MKAYNAELRLMPHILGMEQRGVHLDIGALETDTNYYFKMMDYLDEQIKSTLRANIDIDSNESLADAIEAAGLSRGFAATPTGKRSTSKESLLGAVADPLLLGRLLVRGSVATCLRTFLQPWLNQGREHGRLYIKWNQIRNYSDTGARTGRLSSSPNLQNIPVTWEQLREKLTSIGYVVEFPLPTVRKYIVPSPGHIFIGRDFSNQEMRLLAHFAGGALLDSLRSDPRRDIHAFAAQLVGITRRAAKTLGFAILYGAGVARVAESLGCSINEASSIKQRYLRALPEIKKFAKSLNELSAIGSPIETLGGRHYHAQAPSVVKGVFRSFEYKLLNYKIQGSAADHTKGAMQMYADNTASGHIVLSVHDQLVVECPIEDLDHERMVLEYAMNSSFSDTLRCMIPSDESIGAAFSELK